MINARGKGRGRALSTAMHGVAGLPDTTKIAVNSTLMPNAGWIFLKKGSMAENMELRINYIKQFDRHERDRFTTFFYKNGRQVDSTIGRISYAIKGCWWMNDTAGHNCIVIDGANAAGSASRLIAYQDSPETPIAVVQSDPVTPLYKGVVQTRVVALIEDQYVVFDRVVCEAERTIDRFQWGPGKADLKFNAKPVDPIPGKLRSSGRFKDVKGGPCGKELRIDYIRKDKNGAITSALKMRLISDQKMQAYSAMSWGGYDGGEMESTFARLSRTREANFLATFVSGTEGEPASGRIVESSGKAIAFEVKTGKKTYAVRIDLEAKSATVSCD